MIKQSFIKLSIIIVLIISIFVNNIVYATTLNPNATFRQQFLSALYESTISTTTSTAIQSAMNGDDFTEAFQQQLLNSLVMAGANLGAKQIGTAYHTEQLGKTGQLLLHALLGATANAMTNDDLLSGAVSGAVGEITGDILKNHGVNKKAGTSIAGLMAGLSALLTGKLTGLTDEAISNNIYSGERLGKNAAEHNSYAITACSMGGPIGCATGVTIETFLLFISTGILVVDGVKGLYNTIKDNVANNDDNSKVINIDNRNKVNSNNNYSDNNRSDSNSGAGGITPEDPEHDNKQKNEKKKKNKNKKIKKHTNNQIHKEIKSNNAPKDIDRIDYKGGKKDPTHIHFKDGRALYKDGTWKHNNGGNNYIPSKTAEWLIERNFTLPN